MHSTLKQAVVRRAPTLVALSLVLGNAGLLARHGLHPNLETAVGFLWIGSDYALRRKNDFPILAPRLNAAGVILGSLLLAAGGIHAHAVDWHRVRTPLGYIPAAAIIGFQHELRDFGRRLGSSTSRLIALASSLPRHPYTVAALVNSYGVAELAHSALNARDHGLLAISTAYAVATLALPALDNKPA